MTKKILCIGEVLWDALPEGLFLGGAPFNVACHLKMLGENVTICSSVGSDVLGEQVIKRAKQKSLDTSFIQVNNDYQTGIVDVSLDAVKNASYEIVQPVAWDFIELNNILLDEIAKSDYLVFGTLAQRNAISRKTIEQLRSFGKINIYDVNLRPPFNNIDVIEKSIKSADIIKMNEDELKQLVTWFKLSENFESSITDLANKFNCSTVCITKGSMGSAIYRNNKLTEQEGFKVEVKDTIGAGDSFLAALIHGIINEQTNEDILKFSNAVGSYVASKKGAIPELDIDVIKKLI
ncbi:MAG: carbohydrate kinase [Melioribacteraceae bacterium]|nr:carbohydrate kinase [Melioribacteraceae bacterium]